MSSQAEADSEIAAIRAILGAKPRPVGWQERRQRIEEVGAATPVAGDIVLKTISINGIEAEWSIAPGSDPGSVLLFFHGGGYCSGSILSHRTLVTEAGRAAGMRTLALGYRLAPECPFPAALEDAYAAWQFLRRSGIAPENIVPGGDSAGGGITLALLCRLREEGSASPACGWLISPWTDLTLSGETLASKDAVDPLIHRGYLAELRDAYLPEGVEPCDSRASPLFADLTGLPPLLIQVGSDETLLADATRLAAAAGAADVAVTLEIWPHMIHAWPLWNARLEAGRAALAKAGSFMRAHIGR
ncbi:MAG TPA: alpha/beta hydrolase [Kaistia sp.]|nr:alpha/beta hydrolase [Kaistia sp.]